MSAVQSQKEARTRLLALSRLRWYAASLFQTSYAETVTKNIILRDFSLGRWCFWKTCGTDLVSTGFEHLERMICSRVCPASSNEKEEVSVLARIPTQRHIILRSEITEIVVRGRTLFCPPMVRNSCPRKMMRLGVFKLKYLTTTLFNF